MTVFSAHIFIYGRVQGVFFRQTTYNQACAHDLTGYVRNCLNGSVEAVFEGDESSVDFMINWCKKGPPHASVQGVEIVSREKRDQKFYESFSIESTI